MVVAVHPAPQMRPRLLLIDFELARPSKKSSPVDLWWIHPLDGYCPPEGNTGVDPFAYDVWCMGHVIAGFSFEVSGSTTEVPC